MWPKKEEYVYLDCKIRLSTVAMSDLMYAIIMTKAAMTSSYGVGIYEYTRKQNSFSHVDVKIHIHPSMIEQFEELSKQKLTKPISITINCT